MGFVATQTNEETALSLWLFFFLPLYCWPMTPVSCGSHGFPTVCEGVLHTGSFRSSILPVFSKIVIMIFLFLGLEVVRPEKTQNPLRVKTIFPLEVCFEKKKKLDNPNIKLYVDFFPLRKSNEIVFRVMFKKGFLQLNFVPLKFFL